MKKELGFLPRRGWGKLPRDNHQGVIIHLDFFDDAKKTFFLLKYSDYLESR